jgi:hypothetical protein
MVPYLKVQGFEVQRFKVQGSGFKVQRFKVQGSKVQGSRFRANCRIQNVAL